MLTHNPNFINKHKVSIRILLLNILILSLLISCGNNKKEFVNAPLDKETMPSMRDDSITMLISDSGVVKYKLITKKWEQFENAKDPHWYFSEGMYGEQFDTAFQKQITLKADTAWYFTVRKLWRLKGHVFIENIKDETFSTEELFMDEKQQKIYSDKYIEIQRPEKLLLKGIGFESNTSMTQYRIFKPYDSKIYVNDNQNATPPN